MIDIHCLIHPGYIADFYDQLLLQIVEEPIHFHEIYNTKSIPEGRMAGYTSGVSDYVGFVDCDDLIVPGIFKKIIAEFEKGADIVSCNELLIDENGNVIAPGVTLKPGLYPQWIQDLFPKNMNHHIFCFRRELLDPDYVAKSMNAIGKYPGNMGDCPFYAVKDAESKKAVLLEEIGYLYRRHKKQVTAWLDG